MTLSRLRTTCPHCKVKFSEEDRAQHRRIHPSCIPAYADAREAKAQRKAEKQARMAAKVERAIDRQKREKQKRIPDLIKEAQTAFNAFIRERDREQPCICCGQPLGADSVGGGYDCGHYRSVGSASHLRFDEANAHAQRKRCNRWGAGRAVDYRHGLIQRLGLLAVETLESNNAPKKWGRDELIAIKATYVQKLKELRKEQA